MGETPTKNSSLHVCIYVCVTVYRPISRVVIGQ